MRASLVALVLCTACGSDNDTALDPGADSRLDHCPDEGAEVSGAYSFYTASAATYVVADHIAGVAGFDMAGTSSYTLGALHPISDSLGNLQTYDAASIPIALLVGAQDANCQVAGQCDGFLARVGTYEVTSLAPYRAQFTLSDLVTYDGSNDSGGSAIAGSVTGCVHAAD